MVKFRVGDYIKEKGKPYWYLIMHIDSTKYYAFAYPGSKQHEFLRETLERHCTLVGRNLQGAI